MNKYAQIIDEKVEAIVELEAIPDHEFVGYFVDITELKTMPVLGWKHNKKDNKFIPPSITIIIDSALNDIDYDAAQKRKQFSKTSWGQEATYAEKVKEVNDYISNDYPTDLSNYQWIADEVAISGLTAKEVSELIKFKNAIWLNKLRKIEQIRREAKTKIKIAKSHAVIKKLRDAAIKNLDDLT